MRPICPNCEDRTLPFGCLALATRRAPLGRLLACIAACAVSLQCLADNPDAGDERTAEAVAAKKEGPVAPGAESASKFETAWTPPRFAEQQEARDRMVEVIRKRYGLEQKDILDAMAVVPRHEFVRPADRLRAHADMPLPITHGQTISQPYMVAEMTRLLQLTPDSRVLEVGTGSGYQAAVLTEFTPHVYTVEIIEPLAKSGAEVLTRLGYSTVQVAARDGFYGWEEHAPFDAIIVTCAAGQIPPPLIQQLKPGGRMVVPVGGVFSVQSLMLVEKNEDGKVHSRSLMPVRFVPLTRGKGAPQ